MTTLQYKATSKPRTTISPTEEKALMSKVDMPIQYVPCVSLVTPLSSKAIVIALLVIAH